MRSRLKAFRVLRGQRQTDITYESNYCPNCGAKIGGERG